MKLIGIDFSLNSTGMTLYNSGKYTLYNFVNTSSLCGKKNNILSEFKIHNEIKDFVNIVFVPRKTVYTDYSDEQFQKLIEFNKLTDTILSYIPEDYSIGIEGFSYGSSSRSEIDLIMAATILRHKIMNYGHDLTVISPSQLKKFYTGKGSANKFSMFDSFKITKDNITEHEFYKYVNNNKLINKNGKKILKPIDDIVDSISIVSYLKKVYS